MEHVASYLLKDPSNPIQAFPELPHHEPRTLMFLFKRSLHIDALDLLG